MAERWLRWYDGTVRDGKFRIVAELVGLPVCTVIGVWASLLEDAATSSPRGRTTRGIEHHAMYLGIAEHEIEKIWNALERVGTVRNIGNGDSVPRRFEVLNWDKRQFETDAKDPTAKDRKEKWKQSHKTIGTVRNGAERSGTPETETETETETEKKESKTGKKILPDSWEPSASHYELGKKMGLSTEAVGEAAAEMRAWSLGNGEKRRDWDMVFNNWLRRNSRNGPRRLGTLQDDSRSVTKAAERLHERAKLGELTFGPRPGIPDKQSADVIRLLPKGGGE